MSKTILIFVMLFNIDHEIKKDIHLNLPCIGVNNPSGYVKKQHQCGANYIMEITKKCIKCKDDKSLNNYGVNNGRPDNLKDVCKLCESKRYRANRSYEQTQVISLDNEIWLPLVGYEGIYEVSNLGRVKGLLRNVERKDGKSYKVTKEALIIGKTSTTGYRNVILAKDGIQKHYGVHRLVGEAFIKKIEGKNVINHLDCDRLNNHVSNLEWCTQRENMEYAAKMGRMTHGESHKASKPVFKCDTKGNELKRYINISEAARENNCLHSGISATCRGITETCGGFHWKYA